MKRSPGETPRRLTRAESRERTRAALLEAAATVFVERGYAGASVDAITAAAGYTRGAFYANFDSKEELFAEVLQQRVYSVYRTIAEDAREPATRLAPRALGERLADLQRDPDGAWLFRLWLELLVHAGRDERFREIAAGFWRGNRALSAQAIERAYGEAGKEPPVEADRLASAAIALDIGLALQHFVDPEAAPLDLYPELYELLFGPLAPE